MRRRQRGKQKGAGAEDAQRGSPLSPAGEPEMVEIAESDVMGSLRRSQRIVYLKDLVNDEATASQQNFFDVLAATTNEINELEEQESTELREQLRPLKLSELRKRAAKLQVDEGQIEDAMDSGDNPKEALIGILVKRHRALFADLEMLQLAELQARAVEEKALTEDEVEDAAVRHGDNAKAALIALLLGRDDWDEPPSQPRDTSAADGSSDAAMGGGGGTPDWRMQMAMAQPEVSGGAAERFDVPPTELPTRTGKKVRFSWGKKSSAGSGGAVAASAAAAAEAQAAALQAQVLLAADRIDGRPPFKEGYLKMGGVRRWFELRSGCVLFFLSERDGDLQGNILFAEAIVITVDDDTTQGRHCFDVITPNLFKYRLEATTKNGRDAWLEAVLIQQSERGAMLRGSMAMRSGASDDAASSGRRRGGDAADKSSAAGGKKTPDKKSMSKRELAQLQEQERRVAREERRRRKKIEAEEAAAEAAAAAEAQAEAEAQEAAFVAAQDAFEPELEPEPEPESTRELEASFSTVGRERTSDRRHRRSGSGGASSTASKVGEMKHRRTSSESSLAGGGALDGPAKGDTGSDMVSQLASVTSGELLDEPTTPPRDVGSDASARGDRTIGASPSQLPHLSQAPLDSVQISTVAAAGMSGRGGSSGTTTAARGVGAATTVGAGAGARGAGKFRALIDAHACISDQQFVVTVKCIHGGMNDDQPPDEAALFVELLDEALEDVDDAVQLEVVDLLRNLLQKALKSSKVVKAQRAGRSVNELRPRLEPLGFPDSFIRAFARAFDELDIAVPVERDRGDKARRRTPPRTASEGVPPSTLRLAPADGSSTSAAAAGAAEAVARAAGVAAADGGIVGEVVNEVGAGTLLLKELAAVKKRGTEVPPGKLAQEGEREEEDPMAWLKKPKPTAGVPLPGLTRGQDNDGADALSFFVDAGR